MRSVRLRYKNVLRKIMVWLGLYIVPNVDTEDTIPIPFPTNDGFF